MRRSIAHVIIEGRIGLVLILAGLAAFYVAYTDRAWPLWIVGTVLLLLGIVVTRV